MLISAVILPESLSADRFVDPSYHLNTETLLRGIDANGIILVDANERIYNKICDNVESLATTKKGKTTHALFEELLKKKRQKIVRFLATNCSFHPGISPEDACADIAVQCKADSLITDPDHHHRLASKSGSSVQVIPMTEYISSDVEVGRRRFYESLPSLDRMAPGEFDRLIVGATRFSRWLRFYDKQIGKGTGLSRFRRGIEKILRLWVDNAYFPKEQLSVEVFTVVDDSAYKIYDPSVAYHRVKGDLIEALANQFGLPFKFHFKRDENSICHPRYLQTQSLAVLFEKGFDFVEDDDSLCRTFIKPDAGCAPHLQDYRKLDEYNPPVN
jgi:hypothetical protein